MTAAPAWLNDAEEEDRAELASVGILLDTELAGPSAPADLDAAISTLLRQLARTQLDLERYQAARAREHMTVDARYDRIMDPLAERVAWLESIGRQLAKDAQFPGKAKSRRVAFGSYGKRKEGGRLQITDADKLLAWTRTLHWIEAMGLVQTKVTERVPHAAVAAYLETTGKVPDGCEWEKEYDQPFVKPDLEMLRAS